MVARVWRATAVVAYASIVALTTPSTVTVAWPEVGDLAPMTLIWSV